MIEKQSSTKTSVVRRERGLRLLLVLYSMGIIFVSLTPGDLTPISNQWHIDKVGHFLAYAGLGFLLGLTISSRNGRFLAVVCAIGSGFLLEWGQSFIPGREMSAADGLVNTCGVVLGVLIYYRRGKAIENWLERFLA